MTAYCATIPDFGVGAVEGISRSGITTAKPIASAKAWSVAAAAASAVKGAESTEGKAPPALLKGKTKAMKSARSKSTTDKDAAAAKPKKSQKR